MQVTAESLISTACPDGWLYFADTGHCYLKSSDLVKAPNQEEAAERCAADGGWLIAVESEVIFFSCNVPLWCTVLYPFDLMYVVD